MPRYLPVRTPSHISSTANGSIGVHYTRSVSAPKHEPKKTAREVLTSLLHAAKHILHLPSKPQLTRKLTKRLSKVPPQKQNEDDSNLNGSANHTPDKPTPPPKDSYRVASASQLNGRLIERLRSQQGQTTPTKPPLPRSQSLRDRHRHYAPHPSINVLQRSTTAPLLTAGIVVEDGPDRGETPSPILQSYSPELSTIVEQTEPDTVRPISEVLSIGEARLAYIVRISDYETSIARFAAKAITMMGQLGPAIEIHARRQMAIQRNPNFNPCSPEYFRPYLTKLFTRCCICDINLQGNPIKLSSSTFELGSAGLEVGACKYLNLPSLSTGKHVVLRTEYDPIIKQSKFIAHFCSPLCDDTLENRYTLVSQIDVTDALRRLALQELNEKTTTPPASPPWSAGSAVTTQMRRFLSFIYWLGAHHSNAIVFTLPTSPRANWSLRFAHHHVWSGANMVISNTNTEADEDHMARCMDGDDAFVQAMWWGVREKTEYLQYCVPVTDGRVGCVKAEKWWVCWLVDKVMPGFWGMSQQVAGDSVVEYAFEI
jgi:hypothetical protein